MCWCVYVCMWVWVFVWVCVSVCDPVVCGAVDGQFVNMTRFSPDGALVASVDAGGIAHLYDGKEGTFKSALNGGGATAHTVPGCIPLCTRPIILRRRSMPRHVRTCRICQISVVVWCLVLCTCVFRWVWWWWGLCSLLNMAITLRFRVEFTGVRGRTTHTC